MTSQTLSSPVIFIFWSHALATTSLVARLPSFENSRVKDNSSGSKSLFLYFLSPFESNRTPPSPLSASVIKNGFLLSPIRAVGWN